MRMSLKLGSNSYTLEVVAALILCLTCILVYRYLCTNYTKNMHNFLQISVLKMREMPCVSYNQGL